MDRGPRGEGRGEEALRSDPAVLIICDWLICAYMGLTLHRLPVGTQLRGAHSRAQAGTGDGAQGGWGLTLQVGLMLKASTRPWQGQCAEQRCHDLTGFK